MIRPAIKMALDSGSDKLFNIQPTIAVSKQSSLTMYKVKQQRRTHEKKKEEKSSYNYVSQGVTAKNYRRLRQDFGLVHNT